MPCPTWSSWVVLLRLAATLLACPCWGATEGSETTRHVACEVAPELRKVLREHHPYARGISFALQVSFGALGAELTGLQETFPAMLRGLEMLGWHTSQFAVQVPSEEYVGMITNHVEHHLADIPEIDVLSLEVRDVSGAGPHASSSWRGELLEALLVRVLRMPLKHVKTVHIFCSDTLGCFGDPEASGLLQLGLREFARGPRNCDFVGSGTDVLFESICHPFACELLEEGSEGPLQLKEHMAEAVESMKAASFKLHSLKTVAEASAQLSSIVQRFFVQLNIKQAIQPPKAPWPPVPDEPVDAQLARMPLQTVGCECWAGRLALRMLVALVGYSTEEIRDWVLKLQMSQLARTDMIFALGRAVAELEVNSGEAFERLLGEEQRLFAAHSDIVHPFWTTQRGSVSFNVLLRSGWPIFRALAVSQLRLRTKRSAWGGVDADDLTCERPLAEEFRQHLWVVLEDEQPFNLEFANAFYNTRLTRPSDVGCLLAITSCLLAQAGALQCRAAVAGKPRMLASGAIELAQEMLEHGMAWDKDALMRGLYLGGWPVLSILARLERDYERLQRHVRHFPVSLRTAYVPANHPLWSSFPRQPRLVSFDGGERMLRGGHWAKDFAAHLFGGDPRFAVVDDFGCPDIVVFMGTRPAPNNGIGLYVQAESGEGYLPEFGAGLIYLGPEGKPGSMAEFAAKFDVPFASTSFAFRAAASPLELARHWAERARASTGLPRRGAVAYLASRCVHHREAAYMAFQEQLGDEVLALGACNGTVLEGQTTTVKTASRTADSFLDDSVELMRGFDFAMAYENTNKTGYITEKIVSAYLAGAVPIYWGTPGIFEIFRPESFVYAPSFPSPQKLAQHVASLVRSGRVDAMRRVPILQPGALGRFFSWRSDVPGPLGTELRDVVTRLLDELSDPNM